MYVCMYICIIKKTYQLYQFFEIGTIFVRLSKIHKKFTKMAPYFGIK